MKTFIESKKNHLFTYILGIENKDGFTGIIISNQEIFYIHKDEIYCGNHPNTDLLERNEETWREIFNYYNKAVLSNVNSFNLNKVDECDVYHSILQEKDYFFSNKNSSDNPFSFNYKELLEDKIPSSEDLEKELRKSFDIHLFMIRMERLSIMIENEKSAELNDLFNQVLSSYGFSLKHE